MSMNACVVAKRVFKVRKWERNGLRLYRLQTNSLLCLLWNVKTHPDILYIPQHTPVVSFPSTTQLQYLHLNAPATFQRAVEISNIRFIMWRICLIYLDKITVFSDNLDDHLIHVREVMTVLQDADIQLKLRNCDFFTDTVKYLGHVICSGQFSIEGSTR